MTTLKQTTTFSFPRAACAVAAFAVMSLAIGACGGAPEPPAAEQAPAEAPAQQPPATPAQTFVSTTPAALIKIYQDNDQYQAEEMASPYIDKMLRVDAEVLSVGKDPMGVMVVTSTGAAADASDPTTLHLLFPPAAESSVSSLEAGAKIQAGCTIRRIDKTMLELTDCALL